MSNELIEILHQADVISYLLFAVFILFLIIIILLPIILWGLNKKIKKYKQEDGNIKEMYLKKLQELPLELDTEVEGQVEKRKEIENEFKLKLEKNSNKLGKYEKIYSVVDNSSIPVVCIMLLIMLSINVFSNLYYNTVTGDSSVIRPVENVTSQDISITAYYEIDYSRTNQKTLTVIVKNNSKNVLESADVIESNTNSSETINYIEPGQEKFVSIDVYSDDDNEFNFTIENIKFIQ